MIVIDLIAVPNQYLSVTLNQVLWELTIKTVKGVMAADIVRDGRTLVSGQRIVADGPIIPYAYLSDQGNFAFLTPSGEIPWWESFGTTHQLVYLSREELMDPPGDVSFRTPVNPRDTKSQVTEGLLLKSSGGFTKAVDLRGNSVIQFQNIEVVTDRKTNSGGSWPVLDPWLNGDVPLDPRITFTSGERTYIEGGVLKTAPANTPVFENGAWRLRPQETNLALDIAGSSWGTVSITKQVSAIPAPIADLGTFTKLVPSTASEQHYVATGLPVTEGKKYTISGFFLAGGYAFAQLAFNGTYFPLSGRRVFFDLESGEVSWQQSGPVATIEKLSDGVFRFHATAVATATGSAAEMFYINALKTGSTGISDLTFSGDGTSGIYVWGVQVNEGGPIPYIPTTTSQVTVPADSASIQGAAFAEIWNPQEGAILLDFVASNTTGNRTILQLLQGAALNGTNRLFVNAITNTPYDPAGLGPKNLGPLVPEGSRIGFAWRADDSLVSWHNGAMKGTTPLWPTDVGSMRLPGSSLPTLLRRLTIFTRRPSDAEMMDWTSPGSDMPHSVPFKMVSNLPQVDWDYVPSNTLYWRGQGTIWGKAHD